jgi:hypothetical protein
MSFGHRAGKAPVSASLAAPAGIHTLSDWTVNENSGNQTYLTATAFSGSELVFTLETPVTGLTMNPATGRITADTFAASIQAGTTLTSRATNGSGFAERSFAFTVAVVRRTRPVNRSQAAVQRASFY